MPNYLEGINPTHLCHPGELIKYDILPAMVKNGWSIGKIAKAIGVSRNNFQLIISGKRNISVEMAWRLSKFFENDINFWINLQTSYDMYHTRIKIQDQLNRIIPHSQR